MVMYVHTFRITCLVWHKTHIFYFICVLHWTCCTKIFGYSEYRIFCGSVNAEYFLQNLWWHFVHEIFFPEVLWMSSHCAQQYISQVHKTTCIWLRAPNQTQIVVVIIQWLHQLAHVHMLRLCFQKLRFILSLPTSISNSFHVTHPFLYQYFQLMRNILILQF